MISKVLVLLAGLAAIANAVQFQFRNKGSRDIWIGVQPNPNHPLIGNGGWALTPNEQRNYDVPNNWAGRIWGRTWCDPVTTHCDTGDCGSNLECNGAGGNTPASLAEITLGGGGDGIDFYDVSLVDGFNVQLSFAPINGRGDGTEYSCRTAECDFPVNENCPPELQLVTDHGVVACKSACTAFTTDEYCCRGDHGTPDTCKSSDWPVDYPAMFKKWCPQAYSYAYDDLRSTYTCQADAYIITVG